MAHAALRVRTHIELTIDPRSLGEVDAAGNRVIVPGTYTLSMRGSQPGAGVGGLSADLNITGRKALPR